MTIKQEQRAARLLEARARFFDEATSAARAHGWNENTYRSHENGARGFRPEKADEYARAFKVSFEWLWRGDHASPPSSPDLEAVMRELRALPADVQKDVIANLNSTLALVKKRGQVGG